ncbi:hypothetical protein SLA2020_267060 [Shorea laevis]
MPRIRKRMRETATASTSHITQDTEDPEATASQFESTPSKGSLRASPTMHSQTLPKFDTSRFCSHEVSSSFFHHYVSRNIILERRLNFNDFAKSL